MGYRTELIVVIRYRANCECGYGQDWQTVEQACADIDDHAAQHRMIEKGKWLDYVD